MVLMNLKYYVYALFDEHGQPFYVGKGSGNRVNSHMKPCSLKTKSRKNLKIKELLTTQGFVRRDILCYFDNECSALDFENYLINYYGIRNKGGILTNIIDTLVPPTYNFKQRKPCLQKVSDSDLRLAHNKWILCEWTISDCSGYLGIANKTITEIFRGAKRKYLNLPKEKSWRFPRKSSTVKDNGLIREILLDRFACKLSYQQLCDKYKIPKTTISRYCKLETTLSKLVFEELGIRLNGTSDKVNEADNSISNLANSTT